MWNHAVVVLALGLCPSTMVSELDTLRYLFSIASLSSEDLHWIISSSGGSNPKPVLYYSLAQIGVDGRVAKDAKKSGW